jgi:hypothetical protein
MTPLFPPDYPYRPDAPLLSMGPAFSEEIARSVVSAIWHENREQPHETDVRSAAGLTMLEAFHPRDQLECMLASQGVAAHCAIMDSFRSAASQDMPPQLAIKFRASAVQLNRMFCVNLRELMHLQSKPLPPRPDQGPPAPMPEGDPSSGSKSAPPRVRRARAKTPPEKAVQDAPGAILAVNLEDLPELPEDIATRPNGTPGNLAAYAPKKPVVTFIPREAPIMVALATRPKPWRMVNVPKDQAPIADVPTSQAMTNVETPAQEPMAQRGPIDLRERIFTGDALARFASARLDPNAPVERLRFEHEDSVVELELISTGGDPSAEAQRAAMIAAHPEGKPIVTFRHGTKPPPNGQDKPQSDD